MFRTGLKIVCAPSAKMVQLKIYFIILPSLFYDLLLVCNKVKTEIDQFLVPNFDQKITQNNFRPAQPTVVPDRLWHGRVEKIKTSFSQFLSHNNILCHG